MSFEEKEADTCQLFEERQRYCAEEMEGLKQRCSTKLRQVSQIAAKTQQALQLQVSQLQVSPSFLLCFIFNPQTSPSFEKPIKLQRRISAACTFISLLSEQIHSHINSYSGGEGEAARGCFKADPREGSCGAEAEVL